MNKYKLTGNTIKLTKAQSRVYEGSGPAGDTFRRETKAFAQKRAEKTDRAVEIESFDGITFEQITPETNE